MGQSSSCHQGNRNQFTNFGPSMLLFQSSVFQYRDAMLGCLFHCHNKNAQQRQPRKEGFIFAYVSRVHSLPWQGSVIARTGGDRGHSECTAMMRLKNAYAWVPFFSGFSLRDQPIGWCYPPLGWVFSQYRESLNTEICFNSHSAFSRYRSSYNRCWRIPDQLHPSFIIGAKGCWTSCIPASS